MHKKRLKIGDVLGDTRFVYVVLVAVSIALYANSLGNGFVYDDNVLIVDNEDLRDLRETYSQLSLYRPMRWVTYAVEYYIWELNPLGYHITNLVIHVLCTCLLYYLALILLGSRSAALIAGLFFAAHPIHTEAVDNIANRNDLFATLFLISSLIFYIKSNRSVRMYVLSVVLFLFVLLSKEAVAVTVPFIIILYDLCFDQNGSIFRRLLGRIRYYVPYFAVGATFAFLAKSVLKVSQRVEGATRDLGVEAQLDKSSVATVFSTALGSLREYIRLLFYPADLSPHYPFPSVSSFFEPAVIASGSVCIVLLVLAVWSFRRWRAVSFSLLWIIVTLVPVSNILPVTPHFVAERYLYAPSIGFCILAGFIIDKFYRGELRGISKNLQKRGAVLFTCVVMFLYSIGTIQRNNDWESDRTIWLKAVELMPHSSIARDNLGFGYQKEGLLEKAIQEYTIAVRLNPKSALAFNNLGTAYVESGNFDEAADAFRRATEIAPGFSKAHYNLGSIYVWKDMYEEAEREFREAIRVNPEHAKAHFGLGIIYVNVDSLDAGIKLLERAVHLSPGYAKARYFLALSYKEKGLEEEARREYNRAIAIDRRYSRKPFGYDRSLGGEAIAD
jgi:tetratricopeptide (TPR) repeat protein